MITITGLFTIHYHLQLTSFTHFFHPTPTPVPVPGEPYLKEVIPLAGQNLALPPALEEPPELHEEQEEVVLELLGLLHQHVLLLAPEFLLQPPL